MEMGCADDNEHDYYVINVDVPYDTTFPCPYFLACRCSTWFSFRWWSSLKAVIVNLLHWTIGRRGWDNRNGSLVLLQPDKTARKVSIITGSRLKKFCIGNTYGGIF